MEGKAQRARCAPLRSYSEQFTGYLLSGFVYLKAHPLLIEPLDSCFWMCHGNIREETGMMLDIKVHIRKNGLYLFCRK